MEDEELGEVGIGGEKVGKGGRDRRGKVSKKKGGQRWKRNRLLCRRREEDLPHKKNIIFGISELKSVIH